MDRRKFIRTSCSLCAGAAAGLTLSSLASCSNVSVHKTEISDNKIYIPLSLFTSNDFMIIRPKNYEYDIGLRKEGANNFSALLLRCTHADNQLVSTGNGFLCNLHGSRFDKEGDVIKGPAEYSLKKYTTELNSGNIIIHLT